MMSDALLPSGRSSLGRVPVILFAGRRIQRLAVLPLLALMVACSDNPRLIDTAATDGGTDPDTSSGASNPTEPTEPGVPTVPVGQDVPITAVPGQQAPDDGRDDEADRLPPPAERSTLYLGQIGPAEALLVVDAGGQAMGLLSEPAGGSRLVVGALDEARVRVHEHEAGVASFAPTPWPFGEAAEDRSAQLEVVDGVSVTGTLGGEEVELVAANAEVATPSDARLNGRWRLARSFCDSDGVDCAIVTATLDVQDGELSGGTGVTSATGDELFPSSVSGQSNRLGNASAVDFVWNTYRYEGVLHLLAGETDRLLLLGTTSSELADHPSLAWLLSRDR